MNSNKLEAVLLLTTSREINNGSLLTFVKQFEHMEKNDLDLILCINNIDHDSLVLFETMNYYGKIFKNIEVSYVNIDPKDDIYMPNFSSGSYIPELGTITGPNILFFNSIEQCKKYDTILLLETDCFLKKNVFEKSIKYIETLGDFLISGALYDGNANLRIIEQIYFHLNGVAFYKTGNPELHALLENVKNSIKHHVKNTSRKTIPYDTEITNYIVDKINENPKDRYLRVLYRKFIRTTLIINCSPIKDRVISIEQINREFPQHLILHKKPE
jgi:hypothetical protein